MNKAMEKGHEIWNVKRLYRAGSLTTETRELARYKLDLEGVQEVKVGYSNSRGLYFFLRKGKLKSSIENRVFCTPHNHISSQLSVIGCHI